MGQLTVKELVKKAPFMSKKRFLGLFGGADDNDVVTGITTRYGNRHDNGRSTDVYITATDEDGEVLLYYSGPFDNKKKSIIQTIESIILS